MTTRNEIFPDIHDKKEEVNFKKDFCLKYFDKDTWDLDVLNKVDVHLFDKNGRTLLYIESKYRIANKAQYREAIAQVILTNKKQENILDRVAIIYKNEYNDDVLELIDCSSDDVMHNNDINWDREKASNPSRDAIDRINDRVRGKITKYKNEDIKEFYKLLKKKKNTAISISEKNYIVVYNQWKNEVHFEEEIKDEQDLINLFLVDLLNGTKYKRTIFKDYEEHTLFETIKKEKEVESEQDLIREGTNLNSYRMMYNGDVIDGIKYQGTPNSLYYTIEDTERYDFFWKTYKRPPEKGEFLKILERSSRLYSEKYRKDTGGEYTPNCFVELQNEILRKNYNLDDYIVCDPCAGVGNLENQFGKDFKQYCYLSTLEQMDVDTCKIKGFENVVRFDYLSNQKQPQWKYKGTIMPIDEIRKRENRKLMVIMNPPYKHRKGMKYDMALEFFLKVLKLDPDVIVYYCKTEFFLRENTIPLFEDSNYKIVSHLFSNAKDTFLLHGWPISQVIFDKERGVEVDRNRIVVQRYELNKKEDKLQYINTYTYDSRPCLLTNVEERIKSNASGLILGQWTNQSYCIVLSNRHTHNQYITTDNLKYALVLKGINFNTHGKYFETSNLTYKGTYEDIPSELESDAVVFSLFYKGNNFSNKEGVPNYLMPYTAEELGCEKNELNVLFTQKDPEDLFSASEEENNSFDFRDFIAELDMSPEAKRLFNAALTIFKYYHRSDDFKNKNYNDSFYDITNAIMRKDISKFKTLDAKKDKRITKVKTTKDTKGFSRTNIPFVIQSKDLPIFYEYFDARDALAKKINQQLVDAKILLWERENIY